jgi:lipopolysaccharide export system permease protein
MKILDRYLVKQFLQTLLFSIVAFTLIFVIINSMESLDDFIDENVAGTLIIQYYLVFIPEIIRLILPVSVLLACLFTSGKMSNQNELTAIKASGVSIYRYMAPFVITATIISVFTVYFSGYLVPMANKHRVFIEQTYMKKGLVHFGSNIFFQDSPDRIVTISYFDVLMNQANQVSIHEFNPKDRTKLTSRSDAVRMAYDTTKHKWQMFNGITRTFGDDSETIEKFVVKEYPSLHFKPEDVIRKQRKPEEMTLTELNNFAKEQLRTGNDATRTEIAYQSRIAFSFASIIVVLFGLPLSANRRKSGLAVQFGINMVVTFVYLVFMKIFQAFGENGAMNPMLTAWLANIIFLLAAVYNLKRTAK